MSEELSTAESERYAGIIDGILATANLQTVSAKAIRKGLQEQVDHDLSDKKKAITALIMARFDAFSNDTPTNGTASANTEAKAEPATNGSSSHVKVESNGTSKKRASPTPDDDDDDLSSVADTPPAKRTKIGKSREESDAEYAKRLQAELNRVTGRSTRGGGATTKRKAAPKKSAAKKKKSKARVGSDDDSEAEGSEKKEVKRNTGFHKPMALSEPLSALVNETQLSRPQTVKKIWEYIKARDLQDPNDKRQIICDDAMKTVFKSDRVHMFTMNKVINQHLYDVEE